MYISVFYDIFSRIKDNKQIFSMFIARMIKIYAHIQWQTGGGLLIFESIHVYCIETMRLVVNLTRSLWMTIAAEKVDIHLSGVPQSFTRSP